MFVRLLTTLNTYFIWSLDHWPDCKPEGPYFQPSLSVCLSVSDLHFYPSTLTDFDETWSQGPHSHLVWCDHNGPDQPMLCARRKHRVLAASTNALRHAHSTADDPIWGKVWHRRAAKRYVQKFDIGRVHKFRMERVRKFEIWAYSELGIGHSVRRAFQNGGIRTWGRDRAIKTNRLVCMCVSLI